MNFLIQTVDGHLNDASFTLLEALRFAEWSGNKHEYILTETLPSNEGIPVGSIQFVTEYLRRVYNKMPRPRNVPPELRPWKFSKRFVWEGTQDDGYLYTGPTFAKSANFFKSYADLVTPNLPTDKYQFSQYLEPITSEWRGFVWRGELVGLQNYAGDFTDFPNVGVIRDMIKEFNGPCAYTLDIGLYQGYTIVIEVHDFFSCGLYGFADFNLLPLMLGGWFKEFIRG
jgi:hypothetical protein